ncbi:hypothetical protein [Bradyrhizobium australiense]|uniref:Lipoprotein n=1 Tax=Bradyrhizobium australiense TaxID=2721161 RepID=A0A7Y4LVY5_9BRAD|nr:hypothetical protein [Bradyrhizobium australiense]NOJ40892.1 hypothetical protein [Bradyrhizobium australiense]
MHAARLLLLVLAVALTGCLGMSEAEIAAKKAEFAAKDDEVCKGYGAKPGTDIYIQCRIAQQKARDDSDNAAMMSRPIVVDNTITSAPSTPMLQPIAPPTRCQSMNVGMGRVHTYCN